MRDRTTIFLDLDGVLVDNGPGLRDAYARATSEVLHARLGGPAPDAWVAAQLEFLAYAGPHPGGVSPAELYRWEDIQGVRGPCRILGVTTPEEDECAALGREIDRLVRLEYASFLPGVAGAVRALSASRTVHMASGNAGWAVEGMLERLGIRQHVGLPCGADLVGILKSQEDFYPRLFELAGVPPAQAIVVDDGAGHLANASRAGAATVLVTSASEGAAEGIDAAVPSPVAAPRGTHPGYPRSPSPP